MRFLSNMAETYHLLQISYSVHCAVMRPEHVCVQLAQRRRYAVAHGVPWLNFRCPGKWSGENRTNRTGGYGPDVIG